MNQVQQIFDYAAKQYATQPEYLWSKYSRICHLAPWQWQREMVCAYRQNHVRLDLDLQEEGRD